MHVAGGIQYRGHETDTKSVFYCAFEGAFAFPDRIFAIAKHLNVADKDIPFFFSGDRRTFTKVGGADGILVAVKEATQDPVGMVILDTMARSFEGDENDSEDMKFYIKCAEDIAQDLQCAVVIIHHCGVDGSRPRGHSSLTGACDAQIKIERASVIGSPIIQIKAKVEFMKDGPEDMEEFSILQQYMVDGIEVCYVEDVARPPHLDGKALTGNPVKALAILRKTLENTGDSRILLQEWKDIFVSTVPGTKDSLRRGFDRAREKLIESGAVRIVDNCYIELSDK